MELSELQGVVNDFVRDMGWYEPGSPHQQSPRNLAISLMLEAAEVLEHFHWGEQSSDQEALAGEMADVLHYLLQLAHALDINLEQAVLRKLDENRERRW